MTMLLVSWCAGGWQRRAVGGNLKGGGAGIAEGAEAYNFYKHHQ